MDDDHDTFSLSALIIPLFIALLLYIFLKAQLLQLHLQLPPETTLSTTTTTTIAILLQLLQLQVHHTTALLIYHHISSETSLVFMYIFIYIIK